MHGLVFRRSIVTALFVIVPSLSLLAMVLGVQLNSYEMYMVAVTLGMFIVPVAAIVLIILSIEWVPTALSVIWIRCDGTIGPWSGLRTRVGIGFAIALLLLAVSGCLFGITALIPQDYPGGWP